MNLATRSVVAPKPFLKWVGGKRQLLSEIWPVIHEIRGRKLTKDPHYYEPFVGGGALFFALRAGGWYGQATLGDTNELLIRTYLGVRGDVEAVIEDLQSGYHYSEKEYYAERERYSIMADPRTDECTAAAWMIYMNRTGYNGLFRVSKKGNYNVPFGRYTNPTICDAEGLRAASKALKSTKLLAADFERTVKSAEAGDLVYFDPPYVPVSATSDFTGYTRDGFEARDQVRLRDCALRLKRLGVHVILSNADVPGVWGLYDRGFSIRRVEARRAVNSNAGKRGVVGEVIIT